MVGKLFHKFLFFLMNGERGCRLEPFWREYIEMNCSTQNDSMKSCKREAYPYLHGMVPYRTVPKFTCKRSLNKVASF